MEGTIVKVRKKPKIVEARKLLKMERIQTLNGWTTATTGDYVLTDLEDGNQWPVQKDKFVRDYEILEGDAPIDDPGTRKVLIACSSCWKDLESNQAIRSTWGAKLPPNWDLRFFLGGRNFTEEEQATLFTPEFIGSPGTLGSVNPATAKLAVIGQASDLKPDEILLPNVPDGYLGLPWKTIESLRWALERDYDYVFRIFVDTYAFPDRLLKCGFEKHDFMGWSFDCISCAAHPDKTHSCPLGGCGYWMSRKAMWAAIYYTDAEKEVGR